VEKCLRLKSYLQAPGDGRTQRRIPASAVLGALLMGALLRRVVFAAIEALVHSPARHALEVSGRFGNDALSYFTERLDPNLTRQAAVTALHQSKRHKAFDGCRFIGLALDGTGAGRSWETLHWETVRVVRYRQHKPQGTVNEAYWLTDFPRQRVSSRAIFRMAKSRWEIENPGFNDAKNRYGFEHICHHQGNSLLVVGLLTCLALTIERLYRVRYLHRGTHPILQANALLQLLWLSLSRPVPDDTS
jgi:hypothetical protein